MWEKKLAPILVKDHFSIWTHLDAYYNQHLQQGGDQVLYRFSDAIRNAFDIQPLIEDLGLKLELQYYEGRRWAIKDLPPIGHFIYRSDTTILGYSSQTEEKDGKSTTWAELVLLSHKKEDFDYFQAWVKETKIYTEENHCYALITDDQGKFNLSQLPQKKIDFIPENYSEEVMEKRANMLRNISSKECRGRVNILAGAPGTGKSKLIQSLIPDFDKEARVVYMPAHLVSQIDSPQLLGFLLANSNTKHIFLVEDCDKILVPRGMDTVNVLSSFLNLSDGILGDCLDVHFVVSTNAQTLDFDEAITRPGRLSELITFDLLAPERANQVYQRLTKTEVEPFDSKTSLADIYAKSYGPVETPLVKVKPHRSAIGFASCVQEISMACIEKIYSVSAVIGNGACNGGCKVLRW